jgi:hypothetical protein
MRVLRFFDARRVIPCLGLLASMAMESGCGDQNPVAAVGAETAKQKGESLQKAREAAYGRGGLPVGRPKATAPAK